MYDDFEFQHFFHSLDFSINPQARTQEVEKMESLTWEGACMLLLLGWHWVLIESSKTLLLSLFSSLKLQARDIGMEKWDLGHAVGWLC